MLVVSGNDAAITLAEAIAGSTDGFVQMMNGTARQLGMNESHFSNVNGLPTTVNLVSAHDIGLLAQALMQRFPQYMHYFAEHSFTYNHVTQRNWNPLVFSDSSVTGMKTGHTDAAGYCLVATALRAHRPMIAVVLGSSSRKDSARAAESLLDYGYRFFETHKAYQAGQAITSVRNDQASPADIKLGVAADTWVTAPIGQYASIKASVDLPDRITLPLKKGQKLGGLVLSDPDGKLVEVPLVALSPVDKANWLTHGWNSLVTTFRGII
jgi:D-alanyl-D-alanine carboxypeptidase (penicillin-binding protein 5/6)